MANSESAKSSAYSANAAAQQMRRRIEALESDLAGLTRTLSNLADSVAGRLAGIESDVNVLREIVSQLQEKLS